jgi:hypothetical protein
MDDGDEGDHVLTELLCAYVPDVVLIRHAKEAAGQEVTNAADSFEGAVGFFDISGFSKLSHELHVDERTKRGSFKLPSPANRKGSIGAFDSASTKELRGTRLSTERVALDEGGKKSHRFSQECQPTDEASSFEPAHEDAALKPAPYSAVRGFGAGVSVMEEAQLAARGLSAESLAAELNSVIGRIVVIVNAWGGDVISFVGDALIVVWRNENMGKIVTDVRCSCISRVECPLALLTCVHVFVVFLG